MSQTIIPLTFSKKNYPVSFNETNNKFLSDLQFRCCKDTGMLISTVSIRNNDLSFDIKCLTQHSIDTAVRYSKTITNDDIGAIDEEDLHEFLKMSLMANESVVTLEVDIATGLSTMNVVFYCKIAGMTRMKNALCFSFNLPRIIEEKPEPIVVSTMDAVSAHLTKMMSDIADLQKLAKEEVDKRAGFVYLHGCRIGIPEDSTELILYDCDRKKISKDFDEKSWNLSNCYLKSVNYSTGEVHSALISEYKDVDGNNITVKYGNPNPINITTGNPPARKDLDKDFVRDLNILYGLSLQSTQIKLTGDITPKPAESGGRSMSHAQRPLLSKDYSATVVPTPGYLLKAEGCQQTPRVLPKGPFFADEVDKFLSPNYHNCYLFDETARYPTNATDRRYKMTFFPEMPAGSDAPTFVKTHAHTIDYSMEKFVNYPGDSIKNLRYLKSLKKLVLRDLHTIRDFSPIEYLENLETFVLCNVSNVVDLQFLERATEMRILCLIGVQLECTIDIQPLIKTMKHLKKLVLVECGLTVEFINEIREINDRLEVITTIW